MTWAGWALLSAFFAGATALLAKLGIAGVPSNLAMAIRTSVVLILAWGLVFLRREGSPIPALPSRTWAFLVLSGVATGASWLCYFQALALGPVSRVAPIDKLSFVIAVALGVLILKERVSWQATLGCVLIVAGVLLTLVPVKESV
jgi:bacterial/archaeal transporter family protein